LLPRCGVHRAQSRELSSFLTLVFLAVAAGCDPAGPGASGTINVGETIDVTAFSTLAVRAFPDPSGSFDPTLPIASGVEPVDERLAGLVFPHHYRIGGGIGGTQIADWRLVAWLSRAPEQGANRPDANDVYCSVRFEVRRESGYYGGVTDGVDCTIENVVPAAPAP
jgi:hypothetical protein